MSEWYGPAEDVSVKGTVDAIEEVDSKFGKKQLQVNLVDAVRVDSAGRATEHETATLFIATAGQPAQVFAASARRVLGITAEQVKAQKPEANILARLRGAVVEFGVARKPFENKKTGVSGEMTLYTVQAVATGKQGRRSEVVSWLVGKTPAEVMRGASKFGSYASILQSTAKTRAEFGVELAKGVFAQVSEG